MMRLVARAALAIVLLTATAPAPASGQPVRALTVAQLYALPYIASRFGLLCPNRIVQSFPTSGPAQTTWSICWRDVAGGNSLNDPNGLVIGPVDFQTTPNGPWRRLIYDMRISDFFVPYHPGSPRYYDLSHFNFVLENIPAAGCPASAGATLVSPHVCKEVRDRGLMWTDYTGAARGQELVLWGAIDADNYKYIERYTFRDDGTILGEEGATGQNLPGSETVTHVHNALWRIDVDLFDTVNDAMHMVHTENIAGLTATDSMPAIATATGLQWNARTHDAVMVTNTGYTNKRKHNPAYILMPSVLGGGLTQHNETFTQNDFWVTPYNGTQMAASLLPSYVVGAPSTAHRDLVLWYKGSLHHHPRDEDGAYSGGGGGPWKGTALAMFAGFMLMPYDVFDCSPFYGPCP